MDWLDHYRRLLTYEDWANRATLASLREAEAPTDRALRIMMHVVAAGHLWLARMQAENPPVATWPAATLAACDEEQARLSDRWRGFFERLTPAELARTVHYTNSRGEPWSSTVQDILMHVVLHSAYHRGQVASEVRGSGSTPALTDYIHCVRQGFLD